MGSCVNGLKRSGTLHSVFCCRRVGKSPFLALHIGVATEVRGSHPNFGSESEPRQESGQRLRYSPTTGPSEENMTIEGVPAPALPPAPPATEGPKALKVPAALIAIVCGLLAPIICIWGDLSNSWAAAVLALSTFLTFATWRLHFTRLILVASVAALATALFVALFKLPGVNWWAYLAFACAIIVIGITVALARTIVDQDAFPFGLKDAADELSLRPHLMLWILFILFLQITYLLALAVGIHNKASDGHALIRTQDDSKYSILAAGTPAADEVCILRYKLGCQGDSCVDQESAVDIALNPRVIEQLSSTRERERAPVVRKALMNGDMPTNPAATKYKDEDFRSIATTALVLAKLRERLLRACQPADPARPSEIEILGHANDQLTELPDEEAMAKNDELADRRSEDAHVLLRKLVRPLSVVWKVHSVGNHDTFLNSDRDAFQPNSDHKLCVEFRFGQKSISRTPLTLLDYLYFMIYTITTTGYGDLIPTDAFTQFVVSIANLYEMFFVVIVLNVLIKMPRK